MRSQVFFKVDNLNFLYFYPLKILLCQENPESDLEQWYEVITQLEFSVSMEQVFRFAEDVETVQIEIDAQTLFDKWWFLKHTTSRRIPFVSGLIASAFIPEKPRAAYQAGNDEIRLEMWYERCSKVMDILDVVTKKRLFRDYVLESIHEFLDINKLRTYQDLGNRYLKLVNLWDTDPHQLDKLKEQLQIESTKSIQNIPLGLPEPFRQLKEIGDSMISYRSTEKKTGNDGAKTPKKHRKRKSLELLLPNKTGPNNARLRLRDWLKKYNLFEWDAVKYRNALNGQDLDPSERLLMKGDKERNNLIYLIGSLKNHGIIDGPQKNQPWSRFRNTFILEGDNDNIQKRVWNQRDLNNEFKIELKDDIDSLVYDMKNDLE